MVMITVVGEGQAAKDAEFVYVGPLAECRECKVRNICFHLEPGKRYRITKARDAKHDCKVHEKGVRVVEIEQVPFEMGLPAKVAIEGSTVTVHIPRCRRPDCPHYRLCMPLGMNGDCKIRVVEAGETLECANGEERKRAKVL
ncbi:MAG: UPF0179 family protein [Euryarchaeota archaeon]|nr:UPF0179 family protein [Euryarchaeota archaeon]